MQSEQARVSDVWGGATPNLGDQEVSMQLVSHVGLVTCCIRLVAHVSKAYGHGAAPIREGHFSILKSIDLHIVFVYQGLLGIFYQ